MSEHRPTLAAAATKEVGEECPSHGASECRSGLCLHTEADPEEGYFCSSECQTDAQCPAQWKCTQVHPSAASRVCIPSAEWKARRLSARD
ncbi:hypothetical protein [Myxococcus sp. CA040A]|uniref:hypothetical protein n=1 Tax=Myxococcus sp. CA040A TaxID=2741738 RepID=UPI00157B985E|nr:hypothetical protein [Myxococcus sp. CA040A]NTX06555.1 hypothetical protein [Myxococcus sp. CA040A]